MLGEGRWREAAACGNLETAFLEAYGGGNRALEAQGPDVLEVGKGSLWCSVAANFFLFFFN